MKHKTLQRILSMLLAMVLVLGLLPVMASAATYTKAGEITQITAKSTGFVTPALEGKVTLPSYLTVLSPKDQNIHIFSDAVFTYWQKKDANGQWSKYTAPLFEEGIYRLHIAMFNKALDDGSYYALSSNTALTVDGTPWPTVGLFEDHYSENGQGQLEYYSPEYRVTAPAGYYKVTVTGDGNGTVSADVFYGKAGQTVTLTATPNRMYRLKQWQVLSGGVTVANDQFVMGNSAVEIHAEFESFMVNAGQIDRVEAKSQEDLRPVLGRPLSYDMEVTDPQDVNVRIWKNWTRWEKLQPDGSWKTYIDPTFTYGTYRMMVTLRSEAFEDGRYYPITKNTKLFVDGVEWTMISVPLGSSYTPEKAYGTAYYAGPAMEAIPLLTVSDDCLHCSVVPVSGDLTVPMGDDFSFTLQPKDHYELTDPAALKVYVNDKLSTPDANGVYTVKNATEDLEIYADGGLTAYTDLLITANGVTVKEKVYAGQSYTLRTVAGYGATVPDNSSFTHWKVSGLGKYQPGQSFAVNGGGEIRIDAVFSGLHNITVVGGTAYADAAHTKPLSVAAEDQVIYIVADEAPEGKVFSYWSHQEVASPGGSGWFGNYDSAETTYTVYYSDVVIASVYETLIDEIVINGMTKPTPGVAIDNSDYSYKWGCSVPANSGYSLGICYWYDVTEGEPEFAMSNGDVFQIGHTYRFKAKITLYGDTIFPANAEDISVSLDGIDSEDYQWTINEYSTRYEYAIIYFEFTCEREEPDTAYIRPAGDGTEGNPFQITNVGELYWFAGFVNGTASYPDGVTVEREAACAILMNDITVNPELLDDSGAETNGPIAIWTPIGFFNKYSGTFDGQNHTISGLYIQRLANYDYCLDIGFVAELGSGGCIRDLTVEDSLFGPPNNDDKYCVGGIAGTIKTDASVVNCHFNGTINTNTNYDKNRLGGIAGSCSGLIDNCTVRGCVKAHTFGGAGGIVGIVTNGTVCGCVNNAVVNNTRNGGLDYGTGGIAGIAQESKVEDCCNKGVVLSNSRTGGIVGRASGTEEKQTMISRCWNEGNSNGAGIVGKLGADYKWGYDVDGYATVKNCYNAGTVTCGIVGYTNGTGNQILYCHNVNEASERPVISLSASSDSDIVIEHCYYLADSELDEIDGTTYKTATEFEDGTVLALLNNGHWTQGEDDAYPVLGEIKGVTLSGTVTSFSRDTNDITIELYAEGSASADYTVTVKGNTTTYSIEGVSEGSYTMKVSKKNHVTREYTVVVDTDAVVQNVKIHLVGDIDGNGVVNMGDVGKLYAHVRGTNQLTDEYAMQCANVNGGPLNMGDTGALYSHVRGTKLLY